MHRLLFASTLRSAATRTCSPTWSGACSKTAPEETPEVRIYLQVFDNPPAREGEESERRQIFSGWMFASSPALNALEHPTYDIWAIDCRS